MKFLLLCAQEKAKHICSSCFDLNKNNLSTGVVRALICKRKVQAVI